MHLLANAFFILSHHILFTMYPTKDMCKSWFEFEGELTEEKYIACSLKFEEQNPSLAFFEDYPNAIKVDVSGRDVTHFDNVDKALGLTRSSDLTYESICDDVKPLDVARDEIPLTNGFVEASAEMMAKIQCSLATIDEEGEDEKNVD